jgi:hypothetical protein
MTCRDDLGNSCHHRIRLHFKSIGMPRVSEFDALRNAQLVYGQYGIAIVFASGESLLLSSGESLTLTNVDAGTCRMSGPTSSEQDLLFSLGNLDHVGTRDILVYYVDRLTMANGDSLAGCATHPSGRPACVVAAVGSRWTLGHEVGHVLGLTHEAHDQANLMFVPTASISANPPGLNADQLTRVRASSLAVPC